MIALDLMIGAEAMKIVVIELIGAIVDLIGMIVIAVIVELGNLVAVDGAIVNVVRMRIGLRDDEMMIKIVIADLIVDLLVEMIEMIKEAIGVVEIPVIVEMIAEEVEVGDRLHEMIVGMIVDLPVE